MAVSQDGGNTFNNFLVSEESFYPNSSVFFGDYNNVSTHNNIVRPIWTRLQDNDLSIWTAIIDVDAVISGETENPMIPFATLETNYPNPFSESTVIAFKLNRTSEINLRVYDIFGREVAILIDGEESMRKRKSPLTHSGHKVI